MPNDKLTDKQAPSEGQQYLVFVNYRGADTALHRGPLYDKLSTHFGQDQVFMADHTTPSGELFLPVIEKALKSCNVMLVLIGTQWLAITDKQGRRRLEDPKDLCRREIETVLDRGIPVIPVLYEGTAVPRTEQLPPSLDRLVDYQAHPISSDPHHWAQDTSRLLGRLDELLGTTRTLVDRVVRDEDGALFYIDTERERHLLAHDDHQTIGYLKGAKGVQKVSSDELEPYPLAAPMESVLKCRLKRVIPGGHIYAVLNGRRFYCSREHLQSWGRFDPKEWRNVSEQELEVYPVGRKP